MREAHFFAGGNTSSGFVSYFKTFVDPKQAERIYILKGGPGVGKSTFMRKFASVFKGRGLDIEYIHCSSDPASLDGVMIPKLRVLLVDGTAPHTLDPLLPGAADEILNLGAFLDSSNLREHKRQIVEINNEKAYLYQSAYRYLQCAGALGTEISEAYNKITDESKLALLKEEAAAEVFPDAILRSFKKENGRRMLFTEAYTADGYCNFTDSFSDGKKVIGVIGENIRSVSSLLIALAAFAESIGLEVVCCCMPLYPDMLQHLIIPKLNVLIRSAVSASSRDFDEIIDMRRLLDIEKLNACSSEIEDNGNIFDAMIDKAIKKLSEARELHRQLETYYVSSMDFGAADRCFEDVISRCS